MSLRIDAALPLGLKATVEGTVLRIDTGRAMEHADPACDVWDAKDALDAFLDWADDVEEPPQDTRFDKRGDCNTWVSC